VWVTGTDGGGSGDLTAPARPLSAELAQAIVENSRDFICAFHGDGTVVYTNDAIADMLGWPPQEIVGRNIADYVHPDDMARAFTAIGVAVEHRPRLAPAAFRLRHADGRWIRVEINGNSLTSDLHGVVAIAGRVSHDADLYWAVLEKLIAGEPLTALMATVPQFAIWRGHDTLCAVTWTEYGGTRRSVGSDLPSLLTGVQVPPDGSGPWIHAMVTGAESIHENLERLPPSVRAAAQARGLLGVWVIPVADPSGVDPATITLWSADASAPVVLAEYSARIAEQLVRLILRWRAQHHELEQAARRDGLTGLINRATFFDQLHPDRGLPGQDALLYVDLDGFKPVNDRYGHAAGDRVLRELADRLRSAVRPIDIVGRLGGDEFAVLLRRCSSDEVQTIAHRIRERVAEPIVLETTSIRLGASIGVAMGHAGDSLLEAADRAQIDAKKGGGNRVRWAPSSGPPAVPR
jgi:diguanylate cyclase (GGDEF)-like protein/PAS domain S-box-containing protein